ncbi:MAG: hypothetical protein R3E95_15780 [Thiolinea sp.]
MIGVLGGTLIRCISGICAPLWEVAEGCGMDEVRLDSRQNPATPPATAGQCRAALGHGAACDFRRRVAFVADRRELERDGASFTIDTLQSLRAELGPQRALAFIMGMDAFLLASRLASLAGHHAHRASGGHAPSRL